MKFGIAFNCPECTRRPPGYDGAMVHKPGALIVMPYSEGPRYEARCAFDHLTLVYLEAQKFEVLFEVGAHAILDGYYREAVASFSSSLEQFYEFAIRCFVARQEVEPTLAAPAWKTVSNHSERQYGAFVYLWLTHFKETPAMPSDKMREFRNDVIHKGVIPGRDKAIWYGNKVLHLLRRQTAKILTHLSDEVLEVKYETFRAACEIFEPVLTIAGGTIISTTNVSPDPKPLEDHLRNLAEYNAMVQGYVDKGYTTANAT